MTVVRRKEPVGATVDLPVERPLPVLTPFNEWFWTSGAEGVLRVARCARCDRLIHPLTPVCPSCRGGELRPCQVSGVATIVGFTVNRHQWLPSFPPPYVVANVALQEDPSVRLTTNIVKCDPAELHIGQEVRVVFERQDDVWLPLFEPSDGPDHADPFPDLARPVPRRPLGSDRYEHQSVLSGIGRSAIGRRLMVNPISLAVDACRIAIGDAGLEPGDIDGLSTYPGDVGSGMSEGGVAPLEEALRLRPTWINGGGDLPGQGGAVVAAMLAVASGLCRHVLCVRTIWESTWSTLQLGEPPRRVSGTLLEHRAPFGAMSAAHWIGVNAHHYLERYGATRDVLGWIAVNSRANAALNPDAIYREPFTLDEYMAARPITSPFGLLDCDVPCDGAVAIVVSSADAARDLPHPAIRIDAVGTQILERVSWDQGTVTHEPQVLGQAAHMWSRSQFTAADVDVALIYDGFTFNALSWLEGLGFCELGEAQQWLDGGRRIALDGDLPMNPHGGQLSEGRLHGFGVLHEAVVQLRGHGAARQVHGAKVAVATTGGGTPSSAFLLHTDT